MQFYGLDIDGDMALDYYEFSTYAGVTESAERIFEVMDRDQDNTVTYREVLDSIQMLEQRTTEGTEDIPNENDGKSTDPYNNEGDVPDTQTRPPDSSLPTVGHGEDIMDDNAVTGPDTGTLQGDRDGFGSFNTESTDMGTNPADEPGTATSGLVVTGDGNTGDSTGDDSANGKTQEALKTLSGIFVCV